MSLPRYGEYKDSGATWLGRLPSTWRVVPLKHVADFVNGCVFKPDSWSDSGTPIIRIENLNGSLNFNFYDGEVDARHHVSKGDLLFGWSGNRGTSFGPFIWGGTGRYFLNQHIFKVQSLGCNDRWLYWALRAVTAHVEDQATGIIGMVHVTKGDLGAIKAPVPASYEQAAIADFLDCETAKIDALIAEQEKLIALLAEKRQATISHAVTKGLNPKAPMKDSGVAWLGEVPAHWGACPLKMLARIGNGSTPNRDNPDYWADEGFPWLNSSVVNQEEVSEAERFVTALALKECHLPIVEPPAVLVGITGQGKTRGMATRLAFTATVNQHLAYIKPVEERLTEPYLLRVLEAAYLHLRTESDSAGSTKGAITCELLGNLRIPTPALPEQLAIASFLEEETSKLDKLKSDSERGIALLKERRSALIAAAVTGQIDVRAVAKA